MSDVIVTGGDGSNAQGYYRWGFDGASATATNNGNGVDLNNTATARGGNGGAGVNDGGGSMGGAGGAAYATVSFSLATTSSISGDATAFGGAGGPGYSGSFFGGGQGGAGGATALADVTGGGAVSAQAYAHAGSGNSNGSAFGSVSFPAATGTTIAVSTGLGSGATATAQTVVAGNRTYTTATGYASAYTAAGQRAQATTENSALSFATYATAGTRGVGTVTAITTHAQAADGGDPDVIAISYASAGGDDLYALKNQKAANAYAMATYSPTANFTAPVLADPKLKAAINTVFAGAVMGGTSYYDPYGYGTWTQDFISSTAFTVNNTGLSGDLILGLLAPDVTGDGFSNLVFTVTVNGVEKVDQTFTSLWSAETYFTDNAIDLGAFAGQAALKVLVSMDVTTNVFGETFDSNFVLGGQAVTSTSLTVPDGAASLLLSPASPGQGPGPYAVTANSDPDLAITDRAGTADTIILGAAGQSVLTFGTGSSDYILATPAEAGDLVRSLNHTADILEITTGGTFALNPGDFDVLVKLDQPSTLTLAGFQAGVEGDTGADTIIVPGRQLWSTSAIDLGGGDNALTLQGGGYFDLRAPAVLTGVQTLNAQEGQGSGEQTVYLRDGLDLTVNVASSAGGGIVIHGADNADVINLGSGADTVYVGGTAETINGGSGADTCLGFNDQHAHQRRRRD